MSLSLKDWDKPIPVGDIVVGDCLEVMHKWQAAQVNLCATDPPYNVNYSYDCYDDRRPDGEYIAWSEDWMAAVKRLLVSDGTFWVAIGSRMQAQLRLAAERVGFHWRNTVIWHYTFGPRQEGNFTPSCVFLHYFTKDPKHYAWDNSAVRVPSARQLKYGDRRAVSAGKVPDNVWCLLPEQNPGAYFPGADVWLESRVCGTFKERTSHPAQMPVPVLERVVRACSRPGDLVLDPMCGSGTTLVAAKRQGRRFVGIELSDNYATISAQRLNAEPDRHAPTREPP